jgi:arylsulfatase A-like enzyme
MRFGSAGESGFWEQFPMLRSLMMTLAAMCFVSGAVSVKAAGQSDSGDKGDAVGKPNVVVILADDLGYGDVRCYNPQRCKIATPNIDRLASQGLRFTDGHSSSGVCSPSRYALLTGRYHWRTRLQSGIVGVFGEPLIAPDRLTIAGLVKGHGYRTACIGKWHLGWDWPMTEEQRKLCAPARGEKPEVTEGHRQAWQEIFTKPIAGGPTTRGFDRYFGTDVPNWPPYCFIDQDRTVGVPTEFLPAALLGNNLASLPGPALADWKLEPILPALSDRAVEFIRESAAAKSPFLLYLPLTTPHTPLSVNEPWRGKSGLNNRFADLVMETDDVIGRVLAALDDAGIADETFVLMTADNGCAPYIGAKELEQQGHYPSGPLRGYKADVWEGGHRVPMIVRWPKVVQAGRVSDQLVHHADLIATLADVLGTTLPPNAGEDSFSFLPILRGEDRPIRETAISTSAAGVPGLRLGDWKYIPAAEPKARATGNGQATPEGKGAADNKGTAATSPTVQLYHLGEDIAESKNLAAAQPEKVAQMKELLERLIVDGRSTPGPKQSNDIRVRRYPNPERR